MDKLAVNLKHRKTETDLNILFHEKFINWL